MTRFTKSLTFGIVVAMTALFVIVSIPYPPARELAGAHFTEVDIDTGLRYAFERRLFYWAATTLELLLLCGFALTTLGRRFADRFLAWTGNRRVVAVLVMGMLYLLLHEILYLPIGIGSLYHAKHWGMSNLDFAGWLRDHSLAFGINLVWEGIAVGGLYLLMIVFPRIWWLLAAAGGSLLATAYIFLSPLLIAPLFNDFTPLSQTQWREQEPRVQALIDRADVPVQEILVMDASRQSNHSNAYFAGFGSTRRIVLYDTLLKKHTDAEIESILAHELGHWQHDHIVKSLLLGAGTALLGLFLLDRFLRAAIGRAPWRLRNIADPAGLPLILFLMYLGSWAGKPVENAVSRYFERQADQVSLDLAGQPEAFVQSEVKLARDNKSNVTNPWYVWLFASHPPTVDRIRMAEEWNPEK